MRCLCDLVGTCRVSVAGSRCRCVRACPCATPTRPVYEGAGGSMRGRSWIYCVLKEDSKRIQCLPACRSLCRASCEASLACQASCMEVSRARDPSAHQATTQVPIHQERVWSVPGAGSPTGVPCCTTFQKRGERQIAVLVVRIAGAFNEMRRQSITRPFERCDADRAFARSLHPSRKVASCVLGRRPRRGETRRSLDPFD
mmetsp:Transcript_15715/g.47241  ORF Transcript_15715/g.47241 Transcript_15715/m.47241 type:complete len:200 (+) Transcript_15715:73-672(+)